MKVIIIFINYVCVSKIYYHFSLQSTTKTRKEEKNETLKKKRKKEQEQ